MPRPSSTWGRAPVPTSRSTARSPRSSPRRPCAPSVRSHLTPAINAAAESLPFDDGAFGGALAVYTVHHWLDLKKGLGELRRVTRGPVVVLTSDGPTLDAFWRAPYAPELVPARERYPSLAAIAAGLGGQVRVESVTIPFNCQDGFVEAFYGRPELLLDPAIRAAQSTWDTLTTAEVARFEQRLSDDLASGEWDRRHGALRHTPVYEGSVKLVISVPS